ncbi:MAG: YCF48-related protein [Bacteroidetes bacterium]|nr:YCF48-related protein [Bacteroidota bacterium]
MKNITVFLLALLISLPALAQKPKLPVSALSGITYNNICYAGSHTLYIVGDSGTLLKSVNGGGSFFKLNPQGSAELYSVSFINPDSGYIACSPNKIIYTADGGRHWADRSALVVTAAFSLCATGPNTVYAVGYQQNCLPPGATWPCGEIIKSIDAGISWTIDYWQGSMNTLYYVYFPSADTGYVVGENSTCMATNGSGWISYGFSPPSTIISVHSPHPGIAYAVSLDGIVVKTSNSGISWNNIPTGLPQKSLGSVWFTSDSTGYICGEAGSIMKTTDGGGSWTALNTGTDQWLLSITFSSPDTGFAVGTHETILRTTDAGLTWNNAIVGTAKEQDLSSKLTIYPVPSADNITVEFLSTISRGIITVSDVRGEDLIRQNISGNKALLNISSLPQGLYFVKLVSGDKVYTGKLIRE